MPLLIPILHDDPLRFCRRGDDDSCLFLTRARAVVYPIPDSMLVILFSSYYYYRRARYLRGDVCVYVCACACCEWTLSVINVRMDGGGMRLRVFESGSPW